MNQEEDNLAHSIAHFRESDGAIQSVAVHSEETAELCSRFAAALSLPLCGRLLGLIHDLGKYSLSFQDYLRGVCGVYGEEEREQSLKRQGTIDHATAGAQLLWQRLTALQNPRAAVLAQILSVVVMSHHSRTGMKDFLSLDGSSPFLMRLQRQERQTHAAEARERADRAILGEIEELLASPALQEEFNRCARSIQAGCTGEVTACFSYHLLTRFLFSCLLDADRLSTADFENRKAAQFRSGGKLPDWGALRDRLEAHLETFSGEGAIDSARTVISNACKNAAASPERLLTLTVPTGGGKTLASLRFALHRAAAASPDPIERILIVIPYTSIIDQNAAQVARILGSDAVLEHHSNLTPERDTWRNRVLSENWDAPVVFTTSVQLLDALFNQGTRSARRMHQLANAIVIFDEIQTLPIKTVHLFNNAIDFLTRHCHCTALLCTATMPLLQGVDPSLGRLPLSPSQEIIPDKQTLFRELKRTEIVDKRRPGGWSYEAVQLFAQECLAEHGSVLIVCNTKEAAQKLYEAAQSFGTEATVVHLSTNLCPAHRKDRIRHISALLDSRPQRPLLCISTQLIEAGVDLDFGCVIRSLAGLDSIVQAGGRCNRHRKRERGFVYILNFAEEKLVRALAEIAAAQKITERVLDEFRQDPASLEGDLLSEAAMTRYYAYAFHQRQAEMLYPLKAGTGKPPLECNTSILHLLSTNPGGLATAGRDHPEVLKILKFAHAFSTAAQAFEVIDAPTRGIIVPYCNAETERDGRALIAELAAVFGREGMPVGAQIALLKKAQQYTVNAFPHVVGKLLERGAIREVAPESGIYTLDERHYHAELGVTLEALSEQHYLEVS